MSTLDKDNLKIIESEYESQKKYIYNERKNNIKEIRSILSEYNEDEIELHLGGVAMIANDTI